MARPIKETPILFGDDARRFKQQMQHVRPYSKDEIEKIRQGYEFIKSKFKKNTRHDEAFN